MEQTALILGMLVFGTVLGGAAAWFVLRAKADSGKAVLEERLQGRDRQIDELRAEITRRDSRIEELFTEVSDLKSRASELTVKFDEARASADEKLGLLNEAREKLADTFKALSSEALKSNNDSFLQLAKTSMESIREEARGDLDKRQQAIDSLVKPVKESLDKVDHKINELEKARAGAYESIHQQVKSLMDEQTLLRKETSNLGRALRAPHVRGRWGEIQLKRVVEMAGMIDHCDFYEQESSDTETGRLRPDLLIRLPGGRNVVVDAKAPLAGFLDAVEADSEEERISRLKAHARHIRTHMTQLSRKSYWDQFQPAPEFVVLFLPGETFFSAALEHDPSLIEAGVEQRVILATPTTLIALLKSVAYGWSHQKLEENARVIGELGRELYKRLSDMGKHVGSLGRNLRQAVDSYNSAVGSLETRVLVTARKFRDLETAPAGVDIQELSALEQAPRTASAPELVGELAESTALDILADSDSTN